MISGEENKRTNDLSFETMEEEEEKEEEEEREKEEVEERKEGTEEIDAKNEDRVSKSV